MSRAVAFLGIMFVGYFLALVKDPFYGLLTYAYVYFVPPVPGINWWASYIPFSRWSLLSSAVLMTSIFLHRDKVVKREFRSAHWIFIFVLLTIVITLVIAVDQPDAKEYTYKLVTYSITVWFIIKAVKTLDQYRTFLLAIVLLAGHLSVKAFTEGKRIHARLENIGTNDTVGSNELGLLLGGIIPLMLPFIFQGKWYERLLCVLLLPFMLNAFILCNSRGAVVALVSSLIYTAFLIADKSLRKKILIAAACSIPLFLYLTDAEFMERISNLWKTEETMKDVTTMNRLSTGRIHIWKYGMLIVEDYPLGAGPNSFRFLSHLYMPPEMLKYNPGAEYGVRAAHNTYLQVLVEQGYLGLFIWIMMCLHTMFLLWGGAKKLYWLGMSTTFMGLNMLALNMSFVCSLIGGMVGSRVYYEFFWWQIALSVVTYSFVIDLERKEKERTAV